MPAQKPSSLVDTRVVFCGDDLDRPSREPLKHHGLPDTQMTIRRARMRLPVVVDNLPSVW